MNRFTFQLQPGSLTLDELREGFFTPVTLSLSPAAHEAIQAAHDTVRHAVDGGATLYGINTGFGSLAKTRVETERLGQLQKNLVLSHSTGVGEPLDDATVRLILLLKINSLARGYSGVRPELVEQLRVLLNNDYYPLIPARGSVGASGDLAPLAHLSCALIGQGELWHNRERIRSADALRTLGLEPIELHAKEGLALLNGTQVSTALALKGLFEAEINCNAALTAGSMSVEAVLGSRVPFDARIQEIRGQQGQQFAAQVYRALLTDSEINQSHADCDKVQDPYSLRCQPQVMGACLDQLRWAASRLLIEANAVSDNPLVFSAQETVLSGGNFHAEPVALAADNMALAIAEVGALAERRIALLVDANLSQLPPFLVQESGLNSGFMIAHVTAAALASENKSHAHPASVDSLPTSANQEDHVSMASFAARRLGEMNDNTRNILAIELLAAAQGLTLRRPMKTTEALEKAHREIRRQIPPWDEDRYFASDIEAVSELIRQRRFGCYVEPFIGRSFAQ